MVLGCKPLPSLRDDIIPPAPGGVVTGDLFLQHLGSFPGNKKPAGRMPSGSRLVVENARASAGPTLVGIIISSLGRAAVHCVALMQAVV
jgi:hypothetical protein